MIIRPHDEVRDHWNGRRAQRTNGSSSSACALPEGADVGTITHQLLSVDCLGNHTSSAIEVAQMAARGRENAKLRLIIGQNF